MSSTGGKYRTTRSLALRYDRWRDQHASVCHVGRSSTGPWHDRGQRRHVRQHRLASRCHRQFADHRRCEFIWRSYAVGHDERGRPERAVRSTQHQRHAPQCVLQLDICARSVLAHTRAIRATHHVHEQHVQQDRHHFLTVFSLHVTRARVQCQTNFVHVAARHSARRW